MGAFWKEFARTIARKPGRFLALLAIVALGAGFYAGLRMTAPDMDLALDDYFDATRTYDIRVVSTMGMDPADLDALENLDAVESVMGAYEADVLATMGEASYTIRIHSLHGAAARGESPDGVAVASDDDSYLTRLVLTEGRWPENAGECLISADRVTGAEGAIGSTIVITKGASDLRNTVKTRTLKVVGKVHSPYYVSSASLDASSLGSGVVQQYLYVLEDDFADSYPITEAFIVVKGAAAERYGTAGYDELIAQARAQIEGIADERCDARLESLQSELISNATTYNGLLDLAEYRLSHTQAEIDDPEKPEWLVMGRGKSAGTASFSADAQRVDHIAQVFPFIFFLVAALVALTTMTRMVDEERLYIGTLKALGYPRRRIMAKYLAYALLASGVGSIVGIAVLSRLLPGVIMNAYAIMYYVPTRNLPIDVPLALLSAGLATGITMLSTWASVAATLREGPAALMLPRAPKMGKRILLERIGAIWSRLSFTWKVTFRNLFRYKKRLIMTVIGIAGCTALLLCGLGLHDAINDIIDVQYGQLVHFNAVVSTEKRISSSDRTELDEVLADASLVHSHTDAYVETMLASGPRASDKRIDIVVPSDPEAYGLMKTLRTRVGHEPLSILPGEVLVNEKMAQELGLTVGDVIEVSRQDAMGNATSTVYEFRIGALTENYIYNYLMVDAATYAEATGSTPHPNAVYADVAEVGPDRDALDERLREIKGVRTVSYNDETIGTYRTMLRSVDLIVVVLVVSAAALAFIVLYNLTNINIDERIREIATLKVLGFTRRETGAYIFREIAILALIGAALGLFLGIFLEGFVVTTAEVDQVMFGRSIHTPSFVWAYLATLLFSAVSMLLMLPKLSRVDMVESLKSNE